MSFIKRIAAQIRIQKGDKINIEDIYVLDPQYKSMVENVAKLLHKFAFKFNTRSPEALVDIFAKQVKEEMS